MVKKQTPDEIYGLAILVIGILVIGFILFIIVRVQRGLLGIVLAGVALLLLIYWISEIRKTLRREMIPTIASKKRTWIYDIIDSREGITFVAEVPGPEDQVKVELVERTLKIQGGQEFTKEVRLPKAVELVESRYVNGVLNVRFRKI